MKRQYLGYFLGMLLIFIFISIAYLRPYLYLVFGVITIFCIAYTFISFVLNHSHRAQRTITFSVFGVLCLFLTLYLWKNPINTISVWFIPGVMLGTLIGIFILQLGIRSK